ncbi:rRNA biogenesis protein rrp36-like isoform X2 [Varroa destructor]|uniref:Cilia- and flagella-associated protein 97 n=1 Tax=Varroa destructor TaxID=109461 RepID=A0A7M7M9E3_VARDE|nr:rRNA biogenesis protein rrp36-like isoform X2 [Varroa destructor]
MKDRRPFEGDHRTQMASTDEAMSGDSSTDPLGADDTEHGHQQTSEVDDDGGDDDDDGDGDVNEDNDEDDNDDSSSLSSEDLFESDLESESFTDVTPLHSISNSPLPSQPIGTVASKLRESVGHINEDNAEENSSASSSSSEEDKPGVGHADRRSSGRTSGESRSSSIGSSRVAMRRATVKRAPNRASCHQQNGTASVEPLQIKAPGRAAEVSHLTDAMQKLGLRGTTINNNSTTTALRSRRQREQERRLEAENEQLLKRIIAQQSRVAELVSAGTGALARAQHVAPSTVNRKRQQKFIHAQNLALHKRIEAARNGSTGTIGAGSGAAGLGRGSLRKPLRIPLHGSAQLPTLQRQDSR